MGIDNKMLAYLDYVGVINRLKQSVILFLLSIAVYYGIGIFVSIIVFLVCCANVAILIIETANAITEYDDIKKTM